MFSGLTPTPFWKPMIASYRSPRPLPRKHSRNISDQHLRLTKMESRPLYRILRRRFLISPVEIHRRIQLEDGIPLFNIERLPIPVGMVGNPSRSMKHLRHEFDRVSK